MIRELECPGCHVVFQTEHGNRKYCHQCRPSSHSGLLPTNPAKIALERRHHKCERCGYCVNEHALVFYKPKTGNKIIFPPLFSKVFSTTELENILSQTKLVCLNCYTELTHP